MKDIKFKAWDEIEKIMFDVQEIHWHDGKVCGVIDKNYPESVYMGYYYNGCRLKLLQYIGLKDKNGKEIYEGEIFEFIIGLSREELIKVNGSIKPFLKKVEIRNLTPGFVPIYPKLVHEDDRKWKPFYKEEEEEFWNVEYFIVIGNIYENPELIKE